MLVQERVKLKQLPARRLPESNVNILLSQSCKLDIPVIYIVLSGEVRHKTKSELGAEGGETPSRSEYLRNGVVPTDEAPIGFIYPFH